MFAEDVDLLPTNHFTKLLLKAIKHPPALQPELPLLFQQMDTGGFHDLEPIRCFNGALFRDASALPLTTPQIELLAKAAPGARRRARAGHRQAAHRRAPRRADQVA